MNCKVLIGLLLTLSFVGSVQASSENVRLIKMDLYDETRQRPVKLDIWYPATDGQCDSKICLPTGQQPAKLAIFSHGSFGAANDLSWLGKGLAARGWIVAGISHYGESWAYGTKTIDRKSVTKYWLRAQDVSFVLDSFETKSPFNTPLDLNNTMMVGHSSGGYTAFSLVGADFKSAKIIEYCQSTNSSNDLGCSYARKADKVTATTAAVLADSKLTLKDSRITKVIALDPAIGQAVSVAALNSIDVPVLVVGSVNNDFINYQYHANYYASHIKNAKLVGLNNGEGHFVYVESCSHKASAQGVAICRDRKGVDRKKVQQQIIGEVFKFLAGTRAQN